jgi:hypothetical protein
MKVAVHKRDFSVEVVEDVEGIKVDYAYRNPVYVLSKEGDYEYGDVQTTFQISEVRHLEVIE